MAIEWAEELGVWRAEEDDPWWEAEVRQEDNGWWYAEITLGSDTHTCERRMLAEAQAAVEEFVAERDALPRLREQLRRAEQERDAARKISAGAVRPDIFAAMCDQARRAEAVCEAIEACATLEGDRKRDLLHPMVGELATAINAWRRGKNK
jgi:hypothetical protein